MRRIPVILGCALIALVVSAVTAQAQVVSVQVARPYTPVYVPPAVTQAYYVSPGYVVRSGVPVVAPSYASTVQVVPQSTTVISYSAPPAVVVAPAPGVYTTRTVETRGIFRPRVIVRDHHYTVP